jgi:hypothetical protein
VRLALAQTRLSQLSIWLLQVAVVARTRLTTVVVVVPVAIELEMPI